MRTPSQDRARWSSWPGRCLDHTDERWKCAGRRQGAPLLVIFEKACPELSRRVGSKEAGSEVGSVDGVLRCSPGDGAPSRRDKKRLRRSPRKGPTSRKSREAGHPFKCLARYLCVADVVRPAGRMVLRSYCFTEAVLVSFAFCGGFVLFAACAFLTEGLLMLLTCCSGLGEFLPATCLADTGFTCAGLACACLDGAGVPWTGFAFLSALL